MKSKPPMVRRRESESHQEPIHHNTIRIDVQLAHLSPLLADGSVSVQQITQAIEAAIVEAIDATVGTGLDGIPIPGGAMVIEYPKSDFLAERLLTFDLS